MQTVGVIAASLAVIQGSSPYHTDAGSRVDIELREFGDADAFPRVVVVETDFSISSRSSASVIGDQTVMCEGYIPAKRRDAETVAHRLRADLLRALNKVSPGAFANIPAALGIVNKLELGPESAIRRRVDGLDYVVVQVSCKLTCAVYA